MIVQLTLVFDFDTINESCATAATVCEEQTFPGSTRVTRAGDGVTPSRTFHALQFFALR